MPRWEGRGSWERFRNRQSGFAPRKIAKFDIQILEYADDVVMACKNKNLVSRAGEVDEDFGGPDFIFRWVNKIVTEGELS